MATRNLYEHKADEIDELMQALGKLHREQGIGAVRDVLPDDMWQSIDRIMDLRKVGVVLATEIVLRTGLYCEEVLNG